MQSILFFISAIDGAPTLSNNHVKSILNGKDSSDAITIDITVVRIDSLDLLKEHRSLPSAVAYTGVRCRICPWRLSTRIAGATPTTSSVSLLPYQVQYESVGSSSDFRCKQSLSDTWSRQLSSSTGYCKSYSTAIMKNDSVTKVNNCMTSSKTVR